MSNTLHLNVQIMLNGSITSAIENLGGALPAVPDLPSSWSKEEDIDLRFGDSNREQIRLEEGWIASVSAEIPDILAQCKKVVAAATAILGDAEKNAEENVRSGPCGYGANEGHVLQFCLQGNGEGREHQGWFVARTGCNEMDCRVGSFGFDPGGGVLVAGYEPAKPHIYPHWYSNLRLYSDGVRISLGVQQDNCFSSTLSRATGANQKVRYNPNIFLGTDGTLNVSKRIDGNTRTWSGWGGMTPGSEYETGGRITPELKVGFVLDESACLVGARYFSDWVKSTGATSLFDVFKGAKNLNEIREYWPSYEGYDLVPYSIVGRRYSFE